MQFNYIKVTVIRTKQLNFYKIYLKKFTALKRS